MSKIFTDVVIEDVMLNEWVDENDSTPAKFEIHTAIMTPKGFLLLTSNFDLFEANVKLWVPRQRKAYEGLSAEFQKAFRKSKGGDISIPSYWISCKAGNSREVEYLTDTKEKRFIEYDTTQKGNPIYKFLEDTQEF